MTGRIFDPMGWRSTVIALLMVCSSAISGQSDKPTMELLKRYLVGSYSNAAQAERDTSCLRSELEVRRIWLKEKEGIWLYMEQAATLTKDRPYRQRIHHLAQLDDTTFVSTVCDLDSMYVFTGAYKDVARFNGLKPSEAKPLPGCAWVLHWRNGHFVGGTNANECKSALGGSTYATSEVDIGPDILLSWERGYDDSGTQKWGAGKAGYEFVKRKPLKAPMPTTN